MWHANVLYVVSITKILKDAFYQYLHSGILDFNDAESVRKAHLINIFTVFALLFIFPLGINALVQHNYLLAISLLGGSIILTANYFYLRRSYNQTLSAHVVSIFFFILMIYLVYDGGVKNTGPLWIYSLPMILTFLLGFIRGMIYILVFICMISLMLLSTNDFLLHAVYTSEFKLRIILSLLIVTFLASTYEYLREKTFYKINELSKKLEEVSMLDHLTTVYNRRGVDKELSKACDIHKEEEKEYSILLCDIDHFKEINDSYGHSAGDMVLKKVALEIRDILREEDIVARWGGEEFLILLPFSNSNSVHNVAEKIRSSIENLSCVYEDKRINITVSIGCANNKNYVPIYDVINKADKHMYLAKDNGRNTVYKPY